MTTLFGVDSNSVRNHHFAQFDAWSDSSRPSVETAVEIIEEAASEVGGQLLAQGISASAIAYNSDAYKTCRKQVRLRAAIRIAEAVTGVDSALVESWRVDVKAFEDGLRAGGLEFLGLGTAQTTENPNVAASHVTRYGLQVDSSTDMSTSVSACKRDDDL